MHLPPRHAALLVGTLPATAAAAPPGGGVSATHRAPAAPPLLRQTVADLPVATENRDGYKRTGFKGSGGISLSTRGTAPAGG
ncbi:hypothetical protein FHR32_005614 [Streptosporangium album]|uniref:Uncharacterized protein n=1 Tax=Streptosporangium album TaxID=47479 RepID=A0A7W7S032_9ACTN|nr:hypothetical protein [Streptosporangium album]